MTSVSHAIAIPSGSVSALLHDYSELVKARVTTLIIMMAWSGFYFGALKSGVSSVSWLLLDAMLGIGAVSAGTAALNEAFECGTDSLMRRTKNRPLPTGRLSLTHGMITGAAMVLGGTLYLGITTNLLTSALTFATSFVYLGVYTPMKRVSPICTFLGAFPGAMPPVLGWTAVRGRLDGETFVLFAILFFWQFPHFHSIAWLYREDYERASIRMLPVVEATGRSTVRAILLYLGALVPATLAPVLMGMTGATYLIGALVLDAAFLWFGLRLAKLKLAPGIPESKRAARHLLQASVFYLPLLFALMMINAKGPTSAPILRGL
jgi:heme o synthase